MTIKKEPFQSYTLDEERINQKSKTFTIRISKKDEAWIKELKHIFDIKSDGTVLKLAARAYLNVLHGQIPADILRYVARKDRQRLSDFQELSDKNVL